MKAFLQRWEKLHSTNLCVCFHLFTVSDISLPQQIHLNLRWCSRMAQDIQIILLIEFQGFSALLFSHVWIELVVERSGKTHSCLKKQTGLMGETCLVNEIMSFPVRLHKKKEGCHKKMECYRTTLLNVLGEHLCTLQCWWVRLLTVLCSVRGCTHTISHTLIHPSIISLPLTAWLSGLKRWQLRFGAPLHLFPFSSFPLCLPSIFMSSLGIPLRSDRGVGWRSVTR